MFFALDLLIPQHGGKFSIAWIAATRGVKYVPKKDILQCDIIKLCEDIMTMVQRSTQIRPKKRLSLSLSSRLINGVIKVYQCQVLLLAGDITSFITKVYFPRADRSIADSEDGTPKRPRVRVQPPKRKAREPQLSDEVNTSLLVVWQEPHIEITDDMRRQSLRQLPRVPAPAPEEPRLEEIPEFGILEDVEPPLPPEPRAPQPPVLGTPEKRKRAEAEQETPQPSKRRAVLDAPGTPIRALEIEPAAAPTQSPTAAPTQPPADPTQPPALPAEEARPIHPRRRMNKDDICEKRKRTVNINRCLVTDMEYFDIEDYKARKEINLPDVNVDINNILGVFIPEDPANFIEELRLSRRSTSLMQSTICESIERRLSSLLVPGVRSSKALRSMEPQPVVEPMVLEAEVNVLLEGVEPPPPAIVDSLPLREIQLSALPPLQTTVEEIVAPPAAKIRHADKIVSPSAVLKKVTRERQRNIRDMVQNWDFKERPLTIENICPKPINRKNIAITFNDLLTMSALGYVELKNKPDSLELATIHKGVKIRK